MIYGCKFSSSTIFDISWFGLGKNQTICQTFEHNSSDRFIPRLFNLFFLTYRRKNYEFFYRFGKTPTFFSTFRTFRHVWQHLKQPQHRLNFTIKFIRNFILIQIFCSMNRFDLSFDLIPFLGEGIT